jgi:Transposase
VRPPVGTQAPLKEEVYAGSEAAAHVADQLPRDRDRDGVDGKYWRPVWNILEEAFPNLVLVNPQYVKALKGRKTDRIDAQWLATRLEKDDLKGSFIPPHEIREFRNLTRLRVHWLARSSTSNRRALVWRVS